MADLSDVLTGLKNLALNALYQPTVTIGGTATTGDTITLTATPQRGSPIVATYTVRVGDTTASIATGLAAAWYAATGILSEMPFSTLSATLTLNLYPGSWNPPPGAWSLAAQVSGAATETVTISGAVTAAQVSPLVNAPVVCGMGWPDGNTLDKIAASNAGTASAMVSVFAPEGFFRNITCYHEDWQVLTGPVQTLTATVNATQTAVTIGGAVSIPQIVALLVAASGAAKPYLYQVLAGDTPSTIATALAALVNADTPAGATGPAITIAAAHSIVARIGAQGTVYREIRRQIERFYIDIWAPTPALRTSIGKVLTPAFSRAKFLLLPDLTAGRLIACGERDSDNTEKTGIYRRTLIFDVNYPTIETRAASQIVFFEAQQAAGQLPLGQSPIVNTFV